MSYDTSCTHIERGLEADRTRVSLGTSRYACMYHISTGREDEQHSLR